MGHLCALVATALGVAAVTLMLGGTVSGSTTLQNWAILIGCASATLIVKRCVNRQTELIEVAYNIGRETGREEGSRPHLRSVR